MNATPISTIKVYENEKGEQFTGAVFQLPGCGCQIYGGGTGPSPLLIQFCPLHSTAPDLLEACEMALSCLAPWIFPNDVPARKLRAAIAKARGEKT